VNRCTYCIRLSDGAWGKRPTPSNVRRAILACSHRDYRLRSVCFPPPDANEETCLQCRVCFDVRWSRYEIVIDELVETLLCWLQPEFDSMVEVEISDE